MENNTKLPDDFKDKVEKKVVDKLAVNYKLTNDVTTFISRSEALNIVVAVINAFLSERQKGENKLSDAELKAIQKAVISESIKTEDLFQQIDELMKKEKGEYQ